MRMSVPVIALLLMAVAPTVQAAPCAGFTDVDDTSPFCGNVTFLKNRAITLGCTATLYCPSDAVTRVQMAAFLNRLSDSLFPLTCAPGQVMKWNGTAWACADDAATGGGGTVTSITAGTGLTGGVITSSGTIAADTAFVQRRVSGTCPAGSSIRAIAVDGTVTCQADAGANAFVQGGNNFGTTALLGALGGNDLHLLVAGSPALRLLGASLAPNIAGGVSLNAVTDASSGAFIGGGGQDNTCSSSEGSRSCANIVHDNFGVIVGGRANRAGSDDGLRTSAANAFVGGGQGNTAAGLGATILGGSSNAAFGRNSTVPGGFANRADGAFSLAAGRRAVVRDPVAAATPDGDQGTFLWADTTDVDFTSAAANEFAVRATGGFRWVTDVDATTGAPLETFSIVPGGRVGVNTATPDPDATVTIRDPVAPTLMLRAATNNAFESGRIRFAEMIDAANCAGGYLHYDGFSNRFHVGVHTTFDCGLAGDLSVISIARATGFVGLLSGPSGTNPLTVGNAATNGNGAHVTPTGVWTNASSREFKEKFAAVDVDAVLAKVVTMPVQQWSYRGHDARHIGPTAEDFREAFGLGTSVTHIGTVDADGVALAAIQALATRLAERERELASQRAIVDALERRLRAIEARLAGSPE